MTEKACVYKTLRIIGAKWTIPIIFELFTDKKRFGELQASLSGISPKTLSARLKELEENNIVHKKVYAQVPLKVEYSLTKKGHSLQTIINQMHTWGASC